MRNAKDLRVTWSGGPNPSTGSELPPKRPPRPARGNPRELGVPTHTTPSHTAAAAPGTWPTPRSCPGCCSGCWRRWVRPPGHGRAGSYPRVCTSTACSMPAGPTANAGTSAAAGATTAAPCPTSTPSATATSSATAPSPTAAPTSGSTAWASRPRSRKRQVRRNPPGAAAERCAAAGCDARVRTAAERAAAGTRGTPGAALCGAERGRVPLRSCLGHGVPDFTPWAAGAGWEGGGNSGGPPVQHKALSEVPAERSSGYQWPLYPGPALRLTLPVPTSLPPRLCSLRSHLSQRGHVPGQLQPVVSAPVLHRAHNAGTLTPAGVGVGPRGVPGADASCLRYGIFGVSVPTPSLPRLDGTSMPRPAPGGDAAPRSSALHAGSSLFAPGLAPTWHCGHAGMGSMEPAAGEHGSRAALVANPMLHLELCTGVCGCACVPKQPHTALQEERSPPRATTAPLGTWEWGVGLRPPVLRGAVSVPGKHPCCSPRLLPPHLECREQFLLCFAPTCGGCVGGKCEAWEMQRGCGVWGDAVGAQPGFAPDIPPAAGLLRARAQGVNSKQPGHQSCGQAGQRGVKGSGSVLRGFSIASQRLGRADIGGFTLRAPNGAFGFVPCVGMWGWRERLGCGVAPGRGRCWELGSGWCSDPNGVVEMGLGSGERGCSAHSLAP